MGFIVDEEDDTTGTKRIMQQRPDGSSRSPIVRGRMNDLQHAKEVFRDVAKRNLDRTQKAYVLGTLLQITSKRGRMTEKDAHALPRINEFIKDGSINANRFKFWIQCTHAARRLFEHVDTNEFGFISRATWQGKADLLSSLYQGEDLEEMWSRLDENGDGSIAFVEVLRALAKSKIRAPLA